ncbi:RDD family protein [Streptomyces sp. cg40]|uniref:RDD family protein n=1 Tax=Streptomyces sp. cg40 TaxID=3419764 RepID=UPI003D00A119
MSAPTPAPGDDRPREGYYPDPSIPGYVRYWNGAAWVPGTSRPAPSDGLAPAAPSVEETGPHFFDEDPEPASAWGADRAHQSGFGGAHDRHVSWGTPDPRVPAQPEEPPNPGTFVFHRQTPGPDLPDEGTTTFRRQSPRTPQQGGAPGAQGGGTGNAGGAGEGGFGAQGSAGGGSAAGGYGSQGPGGSGPGAGGFGPQSRAASGSGEGGFGAPGPAGSGAGAFGAPGSAAAGDDGARGAAGGYGPQGSAGAGGFGAQGPRGSGSAAGDYGARGAAGTGSAAGGLGGAGAAPAGDGRRPGGSLPAAGGQGPGGNAPSTDPSGPGFGAGKAAAARAAAQAQAGQAGAGTGAASAAPAAASTALSGPQQPAPGVPQQSGPVQPQASGPVQAQAGAGGTPMAAGPGGGQPSWAQQVHRLAGDEDGPVAPWKPPVEDVFQAAARRQSAARPAGLGKRLVARLIDTLVLGAVTAVAAVPLGTKAADHINEKIDAAKLSGRAETVWLLDGTTAAYLGIVLAVLLLFGVLYEALPTAKWGRTLGKKLCGLEVRGIESHEPPGFGGALRRWLVYSVPGLLGVGIVGVAWCLFDRPWHQCWHDKAAHTFVAG